MAWIDLVILGIIVLSAVMSLWRGFIREAVSLATWLVAFWVALVFHEDVALRLSDWITEPAIRKVTAFGFLFVCVLFVGGVVNYAVGLLIARTGLGGTDRMLGVVFGLARGVAIVAILVLLGGMTTMPGESWWQDSYLMVYFQDIALWARGYLPYDIANSISYDQV
jgi:membrane protein required for colicin V production